MSHSLDPDGGQPIFTPDYEPEFPEDYNNNEFLNGIDMGYIGYTPPEVKHIIDKGKDLWVVEDGRLRKVYVPEEELDDYVYTEGDNWAGSPDEAWA